MRCPLKLVWVLIAILGCGSPKRKPEPAAPAKTARQEAESIQRNLQNALDALQPDRFGVSSDAERSIASLNDWAERARKQAESEGHRWESHRAGRLLQSLPKEWIEQIKLERFVARDASFIRDAIWLNSLSTKVAEKDETDLERVVSIFEFVVRNVELIPSDESHIPTALFEKMMLGRGTAEDRVWLFAEMLRQRQIDCVLLSPRRSNSDDRRRWVLVGVLFEKDIYLFDPYLGVPIPADSDQPQSGLPQVPATLRAAQNNAEILAAVARDTNNEFTLTAESLASARAELICHTEWLSSRMRLLHRDLSGDFKTILSDPLEDIDDVSGLWSRVVAHPSASWTEDDLALWAYPERQLDASLKLTDEQQKVLVKQSAPLGAPRVILEVNFQKENQPPEFQFSRPKKDLMKARIAHLLGHWEKAAPGYLASQLYEIDPPTSKDLAFTSNDEKRVARGLIARAYPQVKKLHESAADFACFWLIHCQAEQHRQNNTAKQAVQYLEQHSSGEWTEAAKSLLATSLARQKKWADAIKAAQAIDSQHPSAVGHQLLINRWKRMAAAEE